MKALSVSDIDKSELHIALNEAMELYRKLGCINGKFLIVLNEDGALRFHHDTGLPFTGMVFWDLQHLLELWVDDEDNSILDEAFDTLDNIEYIINDMTYVRDSRRSIQHCKRITKVNILGAHLAPSLCHWCKCLHYLFPTSGCQSIQQLRTISVNVDASYISPQLISH